jgi:preprotein translocase subunit YajC
MTFITALILAETATPPSGPAGILGRPEFMMVIMVVMFYFLLIRPQQQQKKQMAARIAALQAGDKVVTSSGIHGIVHNVKEHTVMVKVAEGTMLEFDKAAMAVVHKKDVPAAK